MLRTDLVPSRNLRNNRSSAIRLRDNPALLFLGADSNDRAQLFQSDAAQRSNLIARMWKPPIVKRQLALSSARGQAAAEEITSHVDGVAGRSEADRTRTPNSAVAAGQLRGLRSRSSSADMPSRPRKNRRATHGVTVQFEPVSVVKQAIKYGISVSWVIYELMPFGNWKLAGDEC